MVAGRSSPGSGPDSKLLESAVRLRFLDGKERGGESNGNRRSVAEGGRDGLLRLEENAAQKSKIEQQKTIVAFGPILATVMSAMTLPPQNVALSELLK